MEQKSCKNAPYRWSKGEKMLLLLKKELKFWFVHKSCWKCLFDRIDPFYYFFALSKNGVKYSPFSSGYTNNIIFLADVRKAWKSISKVSVKRPVFHICLAQSWKWPHTEEEDTEKQTSVGCHSIKNKATSQKRKMNQIIKQSINQINLIKHIKKI